MLVSTKQYLTTKKEDKKEIFSYSMWVCLPDLLERFPSRLYQS